MFPFIRFCGTEIPSFNICLATALICAALIVEHSFRKLGVAIKTQEKFRLLNAGFILFGLGGAAIFEAIFQGVDFSHFETYRLGLTFYGGLILCVAFATISLRIMQINLLFAANLYSIPLVVAHAIGRIGCFMAGCCFGSETNSQLGVICTKSSLAFIHYHDCVRIHPVQLYEAFGLLIIAVLLCPVRFKYRACAYLLTYPVLRFVLEFYRADERGSFFGVTSFSPSQVISLIVFGMGVVVYFSTCRHKFISAAMGIFSPSKVYNKVLKQSTRRSINGGGGTEKPDE